MRASISLGRIAGIRVGINASVFLIIAILVAGLATGRLPAAFPGRSIVVYVIAAIIAAVLFLASLLAHELARSLVARRNGVEVESIVLWLLGGVAQLKGEPKTPGADFRIAFVGPLTSFAFADLRSCSWRCRVARRRWAAIRRTGLPCRDQCDARGVQPHSRCPVGRWSGIAGGSVALARQPASSCRERCPRGPVRRLRHDRSWRAPGSDRFRRGRRLARVDRLVRRQCGNCRGAACPARRQAGWCPRRSGDDRDARRR